MINRILYFLSLSVAFVELFTYPGFLEKNLVISSTYIYAFYYFGSLLFYKINSNRIIKRLSIIGIVTLIILNILLELFEFQHYPNYVYSTLHVNIAGFKNIYPLLFFQVLILSKSFGKYYKHYIQSHKGLKNRFYSVFSVAALLLATSIGLRMLFGNTMMLFKEIRLDLINISKCDDCDDKGKLKMIYGDFINYVYLIRENTPESSRIFHPPQQSPWEEEGNQLMLRYFLYPRTLISANNPVDITKDQIDYVLVARGRDKYSQPNMESYGWPKEHIKAEEIIYFDLNQNKIKNVTHSDYYPSSENYNSWGLIKVKK